MIDLLPKIKGKGWILELKDARSYDEYLALGFAKKEITESLCAELLKDRAITKWFGNGNLIVNAGLLNIINLVTGNVAGYAQSPPSGWFGYCGVGSGTTAPTSTDSDLQTYIGTRLQVSAAYNINSNLAKFDTFVSPSTWQGQWYECGLFTSQATGSGAMGSHLLVNPTSGYAKGNVASIVDIQWSI